MNLKRMASILLALALALVSTGAFATTEEDYKARIAELEAQVAGLEAQVADLQFQLELQGYVATFDGGHVTAAQAMDRYNYVAYMYQSYGYSLEGYEDEVRQDIMTALVRDAIVQYEAELLGLSEPDAAEDELLRAAAQASLDEYVNYYRANFQGEGKAEEDVLAETTAYLAQNGVSFDAIYADQLRTFAQQALFESLVKDVAVTEDDAAAEYDALVAADQASYSTGNGYSYESAVTGGAQVYWHPEGYRAVKHVLVGFDDAQAARYSEITGRISALEAELTALSATPAPEATAAAEATAAPEPRAAEAVNADLFAANGELDALYGELAPTAAEVVDQFNAGTAIDELIAAYGKDPGMTGEPGKTSGYVVGAQSAYWEAAFTSAAMAIPAVGQISEPVRASNGIHIVYYLADVTPGAIDYESVREDVSATLLETRRQERYDAQIQTWMAELNVEYHPENFK